MHLKYVDRIIVITGRITTLDFEVLSKVSFVDGKISEIGTYMELIAANRGFTQVLKEYLIERLVENQQKLVDG